MSIINKIAFKYGDDITGIVDIAISGNKIPLGLGCKNIWDAKEDIVEVPTKIEDSPDTLTPKFKNPYYSKTLQKKDLEADINKKNISLSDIE